MHLHLFSSPGERDIRYIVEAARPYIDKHADPIIAYLPAAAVGYNWLDYTQKVFKDLAEIALIDVENMPSVTVETILSRAAVLYVSGGNTFLLNHRLHQSNTLQLLQQRIIDGLPVVAFSAGTTLCGPNILTSNDMNMCATTYFSALNLVPYNFSVHYPTEEQIRAEWDEWLQEYHVFQANPILALEDGAYLHVQHNEITVERGNGWLLEKGQVRQKVEVGVSIKAAVAD